MLLTRTLFDRAGLLEGDEGARRLLDALGAGELIEVEARSAGAVIDIDTPDDLTEARRAGIRED